MPRSRLAGLALDLTRGKPSSAQLDLADAPARAADDDAPTAPVRTCATTAGSRGWPSSGRSSRSCSGWSPEQVVCGGNSSLTLMWDVIAVPAALRRSRVRPAVVAGGEGHLHLPRPGVRPALLDARRLRHRDGDRADERRRPGRPRGRGPGPRRPERQGHVGRPDLRQPVGRRLLAGGRRRARVDAHGSAGLPDLLGQRLRLPPPHRGGGQERGHPHPVRRVG